jgi:hypothetical protein
MRNLLATICTCLLGILTVACGGAPSSAPSNPPGSGGASGGPRLAWDQFAPSADELRRYSYVLYVDGSAVPLPGAACGTLAPDTLQAACTASLPAMNAGQHTLEMATRVTENGVVLESARSAPVTYTVGPTGFASGSAGATAAIPGAGTGSPSGDTSSGAGQATGESGFIVETVVNGLDRPTGLAKLPDDRLLVAERGGRIRIVEAGLLLEAPAAELADADTGADESVGLAVAPDFASTRHVYVSYVARGAGGDRVGRVVSFREVAGTLGEAAVLVDGLPVQSGAPRLRIGPDGAVYVGTDALDPEDADDLGSYVGKILRFTMQGNVPPDNPFGSSPVFSVGHRGRVDFDWDPESKTHLARRSLPWGRFAGAAGWRTSERTRGVLRGRAGGGSRVLHGRCARGMAWQSVSRVAGPGMPLPGDRPVRVSRPARHRAALCE